MDIIKKEAEEKNKYLALIVDDSEMNREILKDVLENESEILEAEYEVLEACNGREAIKIIFERIDDLSIIFLDLIMPELGGIDVLRFMKKFGYIEKIPVLVISEETSVEVEKKCFFYGVFDFLHKPFERILACLRIKNAIDLFDHKNNLEEKVRMKTIELQHMNNEIVEFLGNIVEARSFESGQHVKRVKLFTNIIAYKLRMEYPKYDLTPHDVNIITATSVLHDVGKIMISDSILHKPGKLTPEEFEIMKSHTTAGCEVLKSAPKSWSQEYLEVSSKISLYHHEKYDGKGYPSGLKGDEIPISAQIVSIADCFDALTTHRVYKSAYSVEEAYEMILSGKCGVFNPDILDCFINSRVEFEEIVRRNPSSSKI